jgi:hypothetical protein
MTCHTCGRDHESVTIERCGGEDVRISGPACRCLRDGTKRLAWGICCLRELGRELVIETDELEARRKP